MTSAAAEAMIDFSARIGNRCSHLELGGRRPELGGYSGLAAQTLAEIAEIERRIASLVEIKGLASKESLRMSAGSCPQKPRIYTPSRSRSAVTEHVIIEMLERADGRPLKTRELFEGVRAISAHLKYVTFRSYLHRLKQRGVITAENVDHGIGWRLFGNAQRAGNDHPALCPTISPLPEACAKRRCFLLGHDP